MKDVVSFIKSLVSLPSASALPVANLPVVANPPVMANLPVFTIFTAVTAALLGGMDASWAQSAMITDMDATAVGDTFRGHYPTGLGLVTGFGALVGAAFTVGGAMKSNFIGNHRGSNPMGVGQASQSGPAWSMILGIGLMFLMAVIFFGKNSFFGPDVEPMLIEGITQLPR